MTKGSVSSGDFAKALEIGRPPNIKRLFPNSKALIVSGKVIDRAMIAKGKAIAIAGQWPKSVCHPGCPSGSPAGKLSPHYRDRQIRRRHKGILCGQPLEYGHAGRCHLQ